MTIYYCPVCHAENRMGDVTCSRCGAELGASDEDYVSKLISALEHPEPETPVRAAWILGELKERRAVEALERVLTEAGRDPYLLASAVEALGKIGDPGAVGSLALALKSSYLSVRLSAVEALSRLGGEVAERALGLAAADPNPSVREAAERALQGLSAGHGATTEG